MREDEEEREEPLSAGICIQNKQRWEAALALIIENARCPIGGPADLLFDIFVFILLENLPLQKKNCSNSCILPPFIDSAWFTVSEFSSNWHTILLMRGLRETVGTYSRAKASKCEKGDRGGGRGEGRGDRKGGKS